MVHALDTNCLLRWLLWDNEEQALIVDVLINTSERPLHVADLAIAETAWVLSSLFKFDHSAVAEYISKVIEHKNINCNRALFRHVVDELPKSPKVSITDLCLAYYVKLSDAEKLITFDKTLARRLPQLVELAR